MARLRYFGRSLLASLDRSSYACPNCGCSGKTVDRKYVITQLRRCQRCKLLYRTPIDPSTLNHHFYQSEYSQGFTTDLPSDAELHSLLARNFLGTEKDYTNYLSVLTSLGLAPGSRVFDFGCSWGYGSHQLQRYGYRVSAYEISRPRSQYAKDRLGIDMVADIAAAKNDLRNQFDCFFSAHVLEHVPRPSDAFGLAWPLLKRGGIFVSFTPNGSAAHRARSKDWSLLWGEVHPNFIDECFMDEQFRSSPRTDTSSATYQLRLPSEAAMIMCGPIDGGELVFAARKTGDNW